MSVHTGVPVVAILGGGFSGAVTAYHLAMQTAPGAIRIVVIEPRAVLGHGLAYSTIEPTHRINVPAAKMTMVSAEPSHFVDWLSRSGNDLDADAMLLNGDLYPQRQVFGQYIADHLEPLVASGRIEHLAASATSVAYNGAQHVISLEGGAQLTADAIVLAMSHPLPGVPSALANFAGDPRIVYDPYATSWINGIESDARVLVIGTALTAGDVIAALHARGHEGQILALSRRGLRSRGHGTNSAASTEEDFITEPSRDVRTLVRRIRTRVRIAESKGLSWHPVLDAVRQQAHGIWTALDDRERGRLLRHLRPYWDAHRFRIAPQVEAVLDELQALGRLEILAGRLLSVTATGSSLTVAFRPRRAPAVTKLFDRIIITTGPAHGDVIDATPVHFSLRKSGLIKPDAHRLGIDVDHLSRAIGSPCDAPIFVAGPLARAQFGELMGVPEITVHAENVASELRKWVTQTALPIRNEYLHQSGVVKLTM